MQDILLQVQGLVKHFSTKGAKSKKVHALNDVSFEVKRGQTFGIVGESGCGKTTAGRVIMRLIQPTAGEVIFENQPLFKLGRRELKAVRKDIQMVFQDPFASLNPRMTIGQILTEPLDIHRLGDRSGRREKVREILEMVGLHPSYYNRYPHEFSGGQRQRIGIARVLVLEPKLVICDEPVSALDVSIQSQILNLMDDMQKKFNLTYIFIAHGLNVVKHISDRIGVMYLGKMVEILSPHELFKNPMHPYTEALLSAVPTPDPEKPPKRILLEGDIPSPVNPPPGCCFHTRCPYSRERCITQVPEPVYYGERMVACHYPLNPI